MKWLCILLIAFIPGCKSLVTMNEQDYQDLHRYLQKKEEQLTPPLEMHPTIPILHEAFLHLNTQEETSSSRPTIFGVILRYGVAFFEDLHFAALKYKGTLSELQESLEDIALQTHGDRKQQKTFDLLLHILSLIDQRIEQLNLVIHVCYQVMDYSRE